MRGKALLGFDGGEVLDVVAEEAAQVLDEPVEQRGEVPRIPGGPLVGRSCRDRRNCRAPRSSGLHQSGTVANVADRWRAGVSLPVACASASGDQAAATAGRTEITPYKAIERDGHRFLLELAGEAVGCLDR